MESQRSNMLGRGITSLTVIFLSGLIHASDISTNVSVNNIPPSLYNVSLRDESGSIISSLESTGSYYLNYSVEDNNSLGDIGYIMVRLKYKDYTTPSVKYCYIFLYNQSTNNWTSDPEGYLSAANTPHAYEFKNAVFDYSIFFTLDKKFKWHSSGWSLTIKVVDDAGNFKESVFPISTGDGRRGSGTGGSGFGGFYGAALIANMLATTTNSTTTTTSPTPPTTTSSTSTTSITTTTLQKALFDVILSIPEDHVRTTVDKGLLAEVSLFNLGRPGSTDVSLIYRIVDSGGNVVLELQDELVVETQASFIKEFTLSAMYPGTYTLEAELLYEDTFASSSAGFEVVSMEVEQGMDLSIMLLLFIIFLLLLPVVAFFWRRRRERKQKEEIHELVEERL